MREFKVGDKVEIITAGFGCGHFYDIGTICEIIKLIPATAEFLLKDVNGIKEQHVWATDFKFITSKMIDPAPENFDGVEFHSVALDTNFRLNKDLTELGFYNLKSLQPNRFKDDPRSVYDQITIEQAFKQGVWVKLPNVALKPSCFHPPTSVILNSANGQAFRYCKACKGDLGDV